MQRSKRYLAEIASALKPAARGRKVGSGRLLSEKQEVDLRQIICDKRPESRKMAFALWNWVSVMQRIEPDCAIKLSVRNDSPELNPGKVQYQPETGDLHQSSGIHQSQIESGSNCVHAVS